MTHFGIVGTYPPTQCGLATFSAALLTRLRSPLDRVDVVSSVDAYQPDAPPEVAYQWVKGSATQIREAARVLDSMDVVLLQHEFGIFGGPDGRDVVELARACTVPLVVVLHTVLVEPTPSQRNIIEQLVERADAVVTMTLTAQERLLANYVVDPARVHVIPHGAPDNRPRGDLRTVRAGALPAALGRGRSVLTWGLIGPGKGIEWGIEALALLGDLEPGVSYSIVGETHPKVVEHMGERYREGLVARAEELGVADRVHFLDRYMATAELHELVRRADVVLLPYDSRDQVTSGVLVEAVTSVKPVVSTDFPHARELLSSGAGVLVPPHDPAAIATALRQVLTDPDLYDDLTAEAARIAPTLLWPAVADRYRDTAGAVLGRRSLAS
jgi:glycosyltransferase involved in cell wall biosynthesis